jgi:23S rRNA (guanosine2251-2'-O)-methyltransferase
MEKRSSRGTGPKGRSSRPGDGTRKVAGPHGRSGKPEGYKPNRSEGGHAPRAEGEFKPRRSEGGYAPRSEGGYKPRRSEGGYAPRAEGGFKPRRDDGEFKPRRAEGGFAPRAEGGYKPRRAEGEFKPRRAEGGFAPRVEGGYKPRRAEGGFAPRAEGGYKPRRAEGEFKPRRSEGGYAPRTEGGFKPRRDEGDFKPRRAQDSFGPRAEGGYKPRRDSFDAKPARPEKPKVRGEVNEREDFREIERDFTASTRGPRFHAPAPSAHLSDGSILGVQSEREMPDDRIEGRNPALEAFKAGHEMNKVLIEKDTEDSTLLRIAAMARETGTPVQFVDRRKLDAMSVTRAHQGVIIEIAAHAYVEVEDILALAKERNEAPFLVVLDGVTDPNNLGSVIRSAECAGAHGVIIPKRRSVALNATVAKVAAGAHEHLAVARVSNLVSTLKTLKENGVWVAASDAEAEQVYTQTDLKGPIAIVVGGEGEGISRIVRKECDLQVKIPMKGKIDSLNAGVAAALMLFEVARQRG